MFQLDTSNTWEVSGDLVKLILILVLILCIYFFSFQLQIKLSVLLTYLSKKIGVFSTTQEYALQKYVYQNSSSVIARLYNWVNSQLVALSLKRYGVTVVGYLLFWSFVSLVITVVITLVTQFGVGLSVFMYLLIYVAILVLTRVSVSERMEKRELDVMNAIDLIIPEAKNGIKNAISLYMENFRPSVRDDFQAFLINIQDRGYTFEDAMYILADSLGLVFRDFAQKAIYFEAIGEHEMIEIFNDITETNRLRRELRDENSRAFSELRFSFVVSVCMVIGYFFFLMWTDDFSRHFFLVTTAGKVLLLIMVAVVFTVLAYISTIKSRAI